MKRIIEWLIVAMVVAFVLYSILVPGSSRTPRGDVRAKREAVTAEATTLDEHAWAGKYYAGFSRGRYLELDVAPQAGFAFTWTTCTGMRSQNYGTVTQDGDRLVLRCELNAKKEQFSLPATEFFLVRWGQRHYLIPPDVMEDFAQRIREGYEPRKVHRQHSANIYLRDGDWEKPVEGLPEVPEEYQAYFSEIQPEQQPGT